jgi:glycosyltransferase involved in cell wall biosynthesis
MTVRLPEQARRGDRLSYRFLSTYPPTACGLATFTAALSDALVANGASAAVVRVGDGKPYSDPMVVAELENDVRASVASAIEHLSAGDVAIVQHEYGLYGGTDGDEVLTVMRGLTVPVIAVLHTVLLEPTVHQRQVLEAVVDVAAAVIVMTESARTRLRDVYDIDESKIATIAHGADTSAVADLPPLGARPTVLTWGLLGAGKGIEWVIDAMAMLKDLRPRPRYLVAGRTHPKVAALEGDRYRDMLVRRAWEKGVPSSVTFDDTYRDVPSLTKLIQQSAVVVLPYDSRDQVTSGVLVDAIAAGRPVVATAFPHAVELLSSGAGIVVPHANPAAMAHALRRVLTEPDVADDMTEEAIRLAPGLGWRSVARQYAALAGRVTTPLGVTA